MNKPKSKAEAIRFVFAKHPEYTNKQLRAAVRGRYGICVGDNEIINVVGSMKERLFNVPFSKHLRQKAKDYLISIGDISLAIRLLKLAEVEVGR